MNMKRTYEGHIEKAICRPRREASGARKLDKEQLGSIASAYNHNVIVAESKEDAIKKALEIGNDVICICGSLYLIGNIDQIFNN